MFRVSLFAAALTVIASSAFAKDVLRSTIAEPTVIKADIEPAPLRAASFSNRWSGAYAGISGSYTMLKDSAPAESKGATFGAFAGYNVQVTQNIVAGLEVNYAHMGLEFDDGSGVVGYDSLSLRMRGGYAHERFFVYGLVGLERSTATAPFAPGFDFADTTVVYGAGVDVAITDRISLGVEYSRSKYEKFDFPTFPLPVDVSTQRVQARLAFKFD